MLDLGDAGGADHAAERPSVQADQSHVPAIGTPGGSSPQVVLSPDALAQLAEIGEVHHREDRERRILRNYLTAAWSTLGASWGTTLLCGQLVGAVVELFAVAALIRVIFIGRAMKNLDAEEKSAWNRRVAWLIVCVALTGAFHLFLLSLWAFGIGVRLSSLSSGPG